MGPPPCLPYERRTGDRNILIDEDESGVTIRIVQLHKPLRGIGTFFIMMGFLFTGVMLAENPPRRHPTQAIVAVSGGAFLCLLGMWAFVPPKPVPTHMTARADGFELHDGQTGETFSWPREQIVSVVTHRTTDALPEIASELFLRLREDEEIVLGCGTLEEVRELAAAIRRGLKMPPQQQPGDATPAPV